MEHDGQVEIHGIIFVTKNRLNERRRLACMHLHSTANNGSFDLNRFTACRWRLANETVAFRLTILLKIR
ncbi:MAG: hypothetical protein LBP59_17620 [Planctomycetaceae bacterium]|nr:hypothetical protein [Planctomycetaceae bacterium]